MFDFSKLRFLDGEFSSKISKSTLFVSILPILSAAISMYVNMNGSISKTNYIFSIGIILASIGNLCYSKCSKTTTSKFDIFLLCIFIAIAAQFALNLFSNTYYGTFYSYIQDIFEKDIFANLLPLLFSALTDIGIVTFANRKMGLILKIICSLITVGLTIFLPNLRFDPKIVLPVLILPSLLLILGLPEDSKDKKNSLSKNSTTSEKEAKSRSSRLQLLIGCLILIVTCAVVYTHSIERFIKADKMGTIAVPVFNWLWDGFKNKTSWFTDGCKRGFDWTKDQTYNACTGASNKFWNAWDWCKNTRFF